MIRITLKHMTTPELNIAATFLPRDMQAIFEIGVLAQE